MLEKTLILTFIAHLDTLITASSLDPLKEFCPKCSDEAIEPEVFHPQVDLSDYESDGFFSGKSESVSDTESQQESDKEEGTDEDTKMDLDNIKKQEKARARKKRYLQNKKNKKQKLEIDDLPKKFAEQCSTDSEESDSE